MVRKRIKEETSTTRNRLIEPRGQPGENKWCVYVDYNRPDLTLPKVLILNFKPKYAAQHFIKSVIGEDEWEWVNPIGSRKCIQTSLGIRISMFGEGLQTILDYEPTEAEAAYRSDDIEKKVRALKYGVTEEDKTLRIRGANEEDVDGEIKPVREKREPKPKIDKTGLVSASDIAKELGVEGKDVRVVLRALKLEKPAGGWLFDPKTAADIKKKVEAGLKEGKKK